MKIPGPVLALSAMVFVQLGASLSTGLFDALTPAGTAWLRLVVAAVILLAWTRPAVHRMPRPVLLTTVGLGAVTGMLMLLFVEAIARIPLGTAVAIEFLGPLTVAAVSSPRRAALLWPAFAAAGVLALTQPWVGHLDTLGLGFAAASAASWGGYILLTRRVGEALPGLQGLAISLTTAAAVVAPFGAAAALSGLTLPIAVQGLGLGILVPLLPFVAEMLALRRMQLAAFGTLMALEPGIATALGLLVLSQRPTVPQLVGIAMVVIAGIGAQRVGSAPVIDKAPDRLTASRVAVMSLGAARRLRPGSPAARRSGRGSAPGRS